MMSAPQYIINESGERTSVVLPLADYQHLLEVQQRDPDLLTSLSLSELLALVNCAVVPTAQKRLTALLEKTARATLQSDETEELDSLLEQVDQLNILKARAQYTLNQHQHIR